MSEGTSTQQTEAFSRRQQAIVQACLSEFDEKGCFATSVEAIARKAGVATGTVYRHYESKTELLEDALAQACQLDLPQGEQSIRPILQSIAEHFLAALKARNALALFVEGRIECGLKWSSGDFSPAARFENKLAEAFAQAKAKGEIRQDADAQLLAQSFLYQFRVPRLRDLARTAKGGELTHQVVDCFLKCWEA